jgi:acyl carrier protein
MKEKTMNDFLNKLTTILEVDVVNQDDLFEGFDAWDSLTVLSVIAMIDADYNINLIATDLAGIQTPGQLFALIEAKKVG